MAQRRPRKEYSPPRPRAHHPVGAPAASPVRWYALALIVCGVLVYANSLTAPFVFDDSTAISLNPFIRHLWPLTQSIRAPVQSAMAGRPIVSLSLAISHRMGGLDPAVFRAWNIAVLIVSALLLFGILRRTVARLPGEDRRGAAGVAFAAALIWLVHPLQTELVDYVTQRTESMMGMFYLLTLYAAVRAIERADAPRHSRRWTALAIAACALGMGCKEAMVTAPVMVLLYDVTFAARSFKEAWRRRKSLYLGLASTWVVLAALVAQAPRWRSAGLESGVTPWTYLLNQAVMIVTYLRLSVWPHPLVLDYGRTLPIALSAALPYAIVVLVLLAATAIAWWKRPALAFLGSWLFVILAPSSSVVPIATEVGAERRMYLPLAAIAILTVLAVRAAVRRLPTASPLRPRIAGIGALAVAATLLGTLTVLRNTDYQNPSALWQGVLDHRPTGRAHYNLAIELKDHGRTDEAIAHYREAAAHEPAAHYALGFELGSRGAYDEAVGHLREFIRLAPEDELAPKAYFLLGQSLARQNQKADAAAAFRQVLAMRPRDADARAALADLLIAEERYAEAVPLYREYLAMVPGSAGAHHNLGLALVATESETEAVKQFEHAVILQPADPGMRLSLGHALASVGRLDDAIAQFQTGLKMAPSSVPLLSALGLSLAGRGRAEESMAAFQRALQLAPDDPELRNDYQAARAQLQNQVTQTRQRPRAR
jgi:tetratricopeptide (TPR) repeat protein